MKIPVNYRFHERTIAALMELMEKYKKNGTQVLEELIIREHERTKAESEAGNGETI